LKKALQALFPGAIVFVAAVAAMSLPGAEEAVEQVADTYGRVVYGAGLALAWVFYRSRVFIILLSLGLIDVAVAEAPDRAVLTLAFGTALIALIGALALTRDRGLRSRGAVLQMAIAGGIGTAAAVSFADPDRVAAFSEPLILSIDSIGWPGLPLITLFLATCASVAVSYGFYRWRGPVDRALVWSLLLLLIAMNPDIGQAGSGLFLLATGLTLTLSVVETSYILAYRDDLTGLPGRRSLMQYLDGINGTYTIAMVDVDHFKNFNDKHGHDVGDQVLQMVATRLAEAPGGGKAYRYGGEEFTLLFPGRTCEDVGTHLEAVRDSIENAPFSLRSWRRPMKKPDPDKLRPRATKKPKTLSVTVSIGMADTSGDDDTSEVVLKRADQALYRAKIKGRNRVST
jgi:GGDEF domain-containing protein